MIYKLYGISRKKKRHCPCDVAVRMRAVLARTWVVVCVLLALISWHMCGRTDVGFPANSSHVC